MEKLNKIEAALMRVNKDVQDDRKRARDHRNSRGGELLKSLEGQLEHGFKSIQEFKGIESKGGFVTVDD